MEKTDTTTTVRRYAPIIIKSYVAYKILFYLLLGFVPKAHDMYLQYYAGYHDILPTDKPKDITNVREVHGIHNFEDMQPIVKDIRDEAVIFRNFDDCKKKFDTVLYPKRKDQVDTYLKITSDRNRLGNLYVPGLDKTNETVDKSLKDLLKEKRPDTYASFLRIFKGEDYNIMLNADNETKFLVDSSFISHFEHARVSTPIHSAPLSETYSVQCYGVKSWLFYSVPDLIKHGFIPVPTPHGVVINGSPDSLSRVPSKRAIMYPGDVMYFPAFYYHAVATAPGKNIMFAVRHVTKRAIKKTFQTNFRLATLAISRLFVRKWYQRLIKKNSRKGFITAGKDDYTPFKSSYDNDIMEKQFAAFRDIDGFADFEVPEKW